MTEEQIEIKSREYADGRGHEHYNFLFEENVGSPADFARLCYADGLKDGATETTNELQALHKEIVDTQNECVSKLQIEIKQLQEENARLKKDSEENQDLATIAYMQGASKNKTKLDEAKEIIRLGLRVVNTSSVEYMSEYEHKAEAFLKE